MFLILLILFTKVFADSNEDKYVDLLPDAEKQQFIENVARRIIKDVQNQANDKLLHSGELSEEQLKRHNDFVNAILKQEADYARRSKDDQTKDGVDKPGSEEKENNLEVKPLEKLSISNDSDLEKLDLTVRNERRGIAGNDENSEEIIKVEIITDPVAPKIKRSIQNVSGSESSESEDLPSETVEKTESNKLETTTNNNKLVTSTIVNKNIENKSDESSSNESNDENLINVKPLTIKTDHKDIETNNSTNKKSENDTKQSESTTSASENSGIGITESKNYDSNESGEDEKLEVKGNSRRFDRNINETEIISTDTATNNTGIEYTDKPKENKSDEYDNTSTAIEDLPHFTNEESTTTDNVPTTPNVQEFSGTFSSTYYTTQSSEKKLDTTTDYSTSTLTSTMMDEGTTDLIAKTTYEEEQEIMPKAEAKTNYTTESTTKSFATTEKSTIVVEDFTSKPTKPSSHVTVLDFKIESSKQPAIDLTTKKEINHDEVSIEATTKKNKHISNDNKEKNNADEPKKIHTAITVEKESSLKETKISVDKNFIELQKLYYDNNYKVKTAKGYHVYEIPDNVSPFIQEGPFIKEQPYFIPVYNYAANQAYYNPVNRLGPNPAGESLENVGAFNLVDDMNHISPQHVNDNTKSRDYDVDYSDSVYDIKDKKFVAKKKIVHSLHKEPPHDGKNSKVLKVNPEDYIDSDYYFGRVRNYLDRRDNHYKSDKFPNSNENVHPAHSIQELSLKDHVRAVRNILFQQRTFGSLDNVGRNNKFHLRSRENENRNKESNGVVKDTYQLNRRGKEDTNNDGNSNIGVDNYFGKVKPKTDYTSGNKDDKHLQKIGYIQNKNSTKQLFVIDEFYKKDVVKYLTQIKTNDKAYINGDVKPITPHPMTKMASGTSKNQNENDPLTKFRKEEMKRNAELLKKYNGNKNATNNLIKYLQQNSNDYKTKEIVKNIEDSEKNILNDDVVQIGVFVQVLKNMISNDNSALRQYDWLGTSVDIQGSLQKLFDLIDLLVNEDSVHPADMEILKYVMFLHKLAAEIIQANDVSVQLRKRLVLPKNKKKKNKPRYIKEKGLINRVWLYLRKKIPEAKEVDSIKNLNTFLMGIQDGVYNLHDAIKNIAKITKYKSQHWYQNLKELYLNTDEKHVLELLLHMTVSRLFELIEDSATNGLEDNYVLYMKNNKKEAKQALEEMLFAIQILEEINKVAD